MFSRTGVYWHMLPEAEQARKAIWNGIDREGRRIIDQFLPPNLRNGKSEQEMRIEAVNGSIWQLCGSDNYNSLVGSNPVGVVFSEWSLAKPSAWDYIRPILAENNGWALFVFTPRGRNHAMRTLEIAKSNQAWFAQVLTADDTGVISPAIIKEERDSGMDEDMLQQEYYCSFDAALQGSYYGKLLNLAQLEGRIGEYGRIDGRVHLAWDIGRSDDTVIWFYQLERLGKDIYRPRVIDSHSSHGNHLDVYLETLESRGYPYGLCWLPHDAKERRLGQKRTIEQQLRDAGFQVRFVPSVSIENGIAAARKTIMVSVFDERACEGELEPLRQYQREWVEDEQRFAQSPKKDWTNHAADAWRYLSLVWSGPHEVEPEQPFDFKNVKRLTFNDALALQERQSERRRI
jgi:hypothetical protein